MKSNRNNKWGSVLEKFFEKKLLIFFLLTTFFGLILRIYFIFNLDIFTDEVFYSEAARLSSFTQLITHNFWIKDHGIFYLLFLKLAQSVTTDIVFIRLSNLLIYLLISFSLFWFFKKIRNDVTSLIPIALFTFLPYFVFTNVYVSVYNFVILFSVLAFICVSRFILFKEKNSWIYLSSFVIFLALVFYSDYSSIYLYLSLLGVVIFTYFFIKEKFKFVLLALALNFVLILPEVNQFFGNLSQVKNLSEACCAADTHFAIFFPNFLYALFFRTNFIVSLSLLILGTVFLFTIFLKTKNGFLKYLAVYVIFGFATSFIFLYFANRYFLPLLVERTFFFFHFLLIISFYCIFLFTYKSKKIGIFLILLLTLLIAWRFFQDLRIVDLPGNVPDRNIQYRSLITELVQKKHLKDVEEIIIFDKKYSFYPLTNYYFQDLSSYMKKNVSEDFKSKKHFVFRTDKDLEDYAKKNSNQLFIIFNFDYINYQDFKRKVLNKNSNNSVKTFYFLNCSSPTYCSFKKII